MSKSSTARAADEGKDLYETMLAHSTEPRWFVLRAGLVSPTQAMPDREALITDTMKVPCYTPWRDAKGSHWGEPTYATRAEAERMVDAAHLFDDDCNPPADGTSAVAAHDPVHSTAGVVAGSHLPSLIP